MALTSFQLCFTAEVPEKFRDFLHDVRVFLWRRGSSTLSPMVACDGKTPLSIVSGATCLVYAVARRLNDNFQECDVVLGCAPFNVARDNTKGGTQTITTIDDYNHKKQLSLVAILSKPVPAAQTTLPPYMLLQRRTVQPAPPAIKQVQEQKDKWVPLLPVFDNMTGNAVYAPGNATVKLTIMQWLQRVCFEPLAARTSPWYFALVVTWYHRWQQINTALWHQKWHKYPELLGWVCGHHTWTYAYCSDSYLNLQVGALEIGDNWCNSRWVPSAQRGPDCEDNAVDIAATFYAIQDMDLEGDLIVGHEEFNLQYKFLLGCLRDLARLYRLLVVHTVLWTGDAPQLHLYVKLIPERQFAQLVAGEVPHVTDDDDAYDLPILTLDSTRRSWTPDTPLSPDTHKTLHDLYTHLRITDCVCQKASCNKCQRTAVAECFTWGAPTGMWQIASRGRYHTDLRYYDPRSGRVYMPVLTHPKAYLRRTDNQGRMPTFGIPALCLDGRDYLEQKMLMRLAPFEHYKVMPISKDPKERYMSVPVRLVDVTEVLETNHSVSVAVTGANGSEEKKTVAIDPALMVPPPRPIHLDFDKNLYYGLTRNYHPELDLPLSNCVPVFLRACDVPAHCIPANDSDREWTKSIDAVARFLQDMCKQTIVVLRAERIRVQEPAQYSLVFYVHTARQNMHRAQRNKS